MSCLSNRIAKHIYADNAFTQWENSTYYVRDASGNVMATYEREATGQTPPSSFRVAERHLYGSSRLGIDATPHEFIATNYTSSPEAARSLGQKHYEISNHLGNVLSVITDQKLPVVDVSTVVSYAAVVLSATDYSPFGVGLYGRSWSEGYRFGFQGQEGDPEIKGQGNSWNYKYRMHDPRIGRFFAVDPLAAKYPWNSTYAFCENNVLAYVELEGLEKAEPAEFDAARETVADWEANAEQGAWTNISPCEFANNLVDILNNPLSISQGNHPLCGTASTMMVAASMDPQKFVLYCIELYEQGYTESEVNSSHSIKADKDLLTVKLSELNGLKPVEFIYQTSLRSTLNFTDYNNEPNTNIGQIQGVTRIGEATEHLREFYGVLSKGYATTGPVDQRPPFDEEIISAGSKEGVIMLSVVSWNELKYQGEYNGTMLHWISPVSVIVSGEQANLQFWNPQIGRQDTPFQGDIKKMRSSIMETILFWNPSKRGAPLQDIK